MTINLEWTKEHAEFYRERKSKLEWLAQEVDLGVTNQDRADRIEAEAKGQIIAW